MRDVCGITGLPCAQCTPSCEHVKSSLVNSRYAAEHNRVSEVKNLADFYEEMLADEAGSGMTEADIEGPAVKRCGGVEHAGAGCADSEAEDLAGVDHTDAAVKCGVRASVLEEALEVVNGARVNVYGVPENSFSFIGMFWQIVDMADPEMSVEGLTALKMALMKIARILSNPKDRDSWRDAAGYIGLGCDMECAQDIDKDGEAEEVA